MFQKLQYSVFLVGVALVGLTCAQTSTQLQTYKMCVPHHMLEACQKLMVNKPNSQATIQCVPARDRMECLEKVENREADFLAVDPEDMYVAYHLKNEDFSVFSEIRTLEEPEAEFRYEGIILVHKNSNIRSLGDLKGKKSCHTGYGRNVGFKIPITKLKKNGVLKVSTDPSLSPVERELKGLSELFSSSCLVGTYSPNEEINNLLKKRYSNLCALCEHPDKCNYPDKYSGYDGAIRCLVENGGDVAFTKVIYVRKYFGLPIGNNPATTTASANPSDYEYLCEDGSRRPVTGAACSWAQRPWQGYMGNGDVNRRLERLQKRINQFYNDGKQNPDKKAAEQMWIKEQNLVVAKKNPVLPGDHLIRAQYKDVIERDGSISQKIKLCVYDTVAQEKCDTMKKAAYSRNVRPEFECLIKTREECVKAVQDNTADVVVLRSSDYELGEQHHLTPILYETYEENDVMVAVADNSAKEEVLKKATITFDANNVRAVDAALLLSEKKGQKVCPNALTSNNDGLIKIIRSKDLNKYPGKDLVCPDFSRKPPTEFKTCNFDYSLPTAIFVRDTLAGNEYDNTLHAFTDLANNFAHGAKYEDVFELFDEYHTGVKDVIFSDRAVNFVAANKRPKLIDRAHYKQLHCK